MPELLPEQFTGPGTTASDVAPWMTYDAEMTEKLSPQLESEIAEYSKRRHDRSSTQNEEELCRQKEANQELAKQYQWLTPEEYVDEGPRIGTPMDYQEFIVHLRDGCGLHCWYKEHPHPDKVTLLYGNSMGTMEPTVGCWVQFGTMPEYSFVRFDDHGIPLNERRRGWRTCLLQLILKGVLTVETVNAVFGEAHGPASERYRRTLYEFRNRSEEWRASEEL